MWNKRKPARDFRRLCTIAMCVCALLTMTAASNVYARDTHRRIIKVGRFPYDELMSVGENGNYRGYGYDYLQEIARYTNWRYEFVDASWDDGLTMLANGDIDLLGGVMRSKEREEVFDFSEIPMLSGYGVLATSLDNQTLAYEDFQAFDGLRVGVLKGNLHRESFLEYSREHSFTPVIQEYTSEEQLSAALDSGDADAIVLTNLLHSSTLRIVAAFGENDAYFATTKGNTDVLNTLNDALRQVRLTDPYFNSKLDQNYYDLQASTSISFTREELDFIKNSSPIPCVYIPNASPINSYNPSTEAVDGISVDICKLLEERTGLTFCWLKPDSANEAVDMLQRGEALILSAKYYDFNWAEQNGVMLTNPYLHGQMIMLTNSPDAEDSQSRLIADSFSGDVQTKQYPSIDACVDAVLRGDANTAFVNSTIASYLSNDPKYAALHTIPLYGLPADVSMAVSDYANPLLYSVINKGLRNISSTEINQIVLSQMKQTQAGMVATYFYLHPLKIVFLLAMISLALILVLSVLLFTWRKSTKKIKNALYMDPLTGYANYYALGYEAEDLIGGHPQGFALIYLDIHRFKAINDTFGYEVGDQVLIATSDVLHNFLEQDERFARVHADIFALLLKYDSADELRKRLDLLSARLEQLFSDAPNSVNPLFCGGVYLFPNKFDSLDKALDCANYAKSSITHHFSNTFVFYDDIMRNQVLNEKKLERSMASALENEEFVPYYQPKVNALTGKVIGAEALVRWHHPEKGWLSPGEFLPFYEKNGFVVKIDLSIFERVCRDMQNWSKKGYPPISVSVNFSRRNLQNKQLPQKLKDIAARYEIPANLLEIEITETEELENVDIAVGFVNALKALDFGVSIDDYGTGYSSISFLQVLPLNTLKLDRQFILNAMDTDKAKDIMRYLVASMERNKIRIICEGIETVKQRDFVISLNCRYIQGYLYSVPLPLEAFESYFTLHGVEIPDDLILMPLTHFSKNRWGDAEDFITGALPSWIVCSLDETNYPVQYISPNFLEAMGYSELEFRAATNCLYVNWVHPDDLESALTNLLQKRTGLQNISLQYRLRKKDGRYVWIQEINKRVITECGEKVLVSICTDISDLVALQSEKSQLIATIPGGVATLLLTENGPIIQQASDSFYDVIGYTNNEMAALDDNLCSIFYPQDLPRAMSMLEQLLNTDKQTCESTFRVQQREGNLHWVTFRGTMVRNATELLATVIIFNSDEEMAHRQEANISQAKLALALTLTDHAMFEYDIASKTVYSHSGFADYGIADGMVINVRSDMIENGFVHPDDVENILHTQTRISKGDTYVCYDIRIRSKYGDADAPYIWIRITLTTIFNEDDQPARAVGVVENIHTRKEAEQDLMEQATRDSLTGVLNRCTAEERIENFLSTQAKPGLTQAFLMLDLDCFKQVNDAYGHHTGDKYLITFAKMMRKYIKDGDILARIGGDEFVIFLTNLHDKCEALSTANALWHDTKNIKSILGIDSLTSTSIGIASAPPQKMNFDSMYQCADQAMYKAKKKTGIHVAVFQE